VKACDGEFFGSQLSIRNKSIESAYASLKRGVKGRTVDNIKDINGIRIIVESIQDFFGIASSPEAMANIFALFKKLYGLNISNYSWYDKITFPKST